MDAWKMRWGVGQWAAYFDNHDLPVMRRSKLLMAQLAEGELLSPRDPGGRCFAGPDALPTPFA